MPVEIEAKLRFADLDEVRRRLREAGATPMGQALEADSFFDTAERSLLAQDAGLRVRVNRDLPGGAERVIVTYKGPRQPGAVKSREELELAVANADDAAVLLQRLGYERVLTFEKRRESWRLEDCRVELDELPHLGSFVEIEGPSETRVEAVRARLGLGDLPHEPASYAAMLTGYLRAHGIAERVVRLAGDAAPGG